MVRGPRNYLWCVDQYRMRKTMSAPSSFCPITIRPLCNRCALEPSTYSWSSYGAKTSEWIAFMHFLIKSHLEPSVTVGKLKYVCLCIWPILQQVVIESLKMTNIQIPSSCLMPNIWNIVQSCVTLELDCFAQNHDDMRHQRLFMTRPSS